MLRCLSACVLAILFASTVHSASAAELIMVERDDCHWCHVWDREIGRTYNQTPVGRIAPLRRVNLYAPKPADLAHVNLGRFTPTFLLMENGEVVGRMRGYPGKTNFWFLLKDRMRKLSILKPEKSEPLNKIDFRAVQ